MKSDTNAIENISYISITQKQHTSHTVQSIRHSTMALKNINNLSAVIIQVR